MKNLYEVNNIKRKFYKFIIFFLLIIILFYLKNKNINFFKSINFFFYLKILNFI